jgi:hypothetical protein
MSQVPSPLPAALRFRWTEGEPSTITDQPLAVDVTSLDFVRYATCVLGPHVVCLTQLVAADLVDTYRCSYPAWFLAESLGLSDASGEHRRLRLVLVRACRFGAFQFVDDEFLVSSRWVPDWSWCESLLGGTDDR